MPRAVYIVVSSSNDPAREQEFQDWYTVHARDILSVPGVVAGTRYWLADQINPGVLNPGQGRYLAVWEIDADDPAAVVANIWKGARQWSAEGRGTDLFEMVYHGIYQPITDRMQGTPLPAQSAAQ